MAQLIDVLAMLVRKNLGHLKIGKSRDILFVGKTIEEAYELEQDRKSEERTQGDFGTESGDHGALVIFRVNTDGNKPAPWIVERQDADGKPF